MPLGIKLVQAAQKEAALGRPYPLNAEAVESLPKGGEVRATAQIVDNDRLSKLASKVTVSVGGATKPARPTDPQTKAEKFAEKATYLTEKLRFVETDLGGAAQVRSTPETMAGRGAPYFEAKVKDNEITLRRFQAKAKGGRQSVPFCLTDDILARVVEDAAEVLTPKR
jgi:hypothetical protein